MEEAFKKQQEEMYERLKHQILFPFNGSPAPNTELLDQAQQRLQPEMIKFTSYPTPPSSESKSEDDVKVSAASVKKGQNNNNNSSSWSYEDQFKQVRQVSR